MSAFAGLLAAIVADDRKAVRALLQRDPELATATRSAPQLYQGAIEHWHYAGDTALHLAAAGYRKALVEELVKAQANPNAVGKHRGATPLHYAADGLPGSDAWNPRRQVDTLAALIAAGARVDAVDKNGATPLHRAVRTRAAAAVEELLRHGGDPSLRNKPGSTCFHLAVQTTGRGGTGSEPARNEQRRIIELLLEQGLSPGLRDANGKTVREAAQSDWVRELLGV